MRKFIASLITIGAIVPMFWFQVTPNGVAICSSDIAFNTPLDTQAQRIAAGYAKDRFCRVVESFPL